MALFCDIIYLNILSKLIFTKEVSRGYIYCYLRLDVLFNDFWRVVFPKNKNF